MKKFVASCLIAWSVASVFVIASARAAPASLYAIGADAGGVGRVFTSIDPATTGVPLGDGSLAFNGGLAYRASDDLVYAISNDSSGNSRLVSFRTSAPATFVSSISVGAGFLGGLAFGAGGTTLYAIASDSTALSSLYAIGVTSGTTTDLGVLGYGYFGGLTFDPTVGSFLAISGDSFGVQRSLERITLGAGGPTVTSLFDLGDGSVAFNGGLTFDASTNGFLSIGNDAFGASSLYAFDTSGASSLALQSLALAPGFMNVGLTFAPAATGGGGTNPGSVPEPATLALVALAAAAGATRRARRPRSRTPDRRSRSSDPSDGSSAGLSPFLSTDTRTLA